MLTEYALLLILSIVMVTVVLTGGSFDPGGGVRGIFTDGVPQLAIRMEKYLTTGYPFCEQFSGPEGCSWQ